MSLGKQRAEIDEEMSAEDQRAYEQFIGMYDQSMRNLAEGEIVKGRVVTITNNSVVIDVGYKSEGLIPVAEFFNEEGKLTVAVGDDEERLVGVCDPRLFQEQQNEQRNGHGNDGEVPSPEEMRAEDEHAEDGGEEAEEVHGRGSLLR